MASMNNTSETPTEDNCAQLAFFFSRNDPFGSEPRYVKPLIFVIYLCVLSFGAMGNLLVITAVIRNPVLRMPRNFFIVNLALSDFLLCTVTVPFTMKMMFNLYWDLGYIACKIVSTAQGVNMFVSTLSITAIGLDRYIVIIFPTKSVHMMRSAITVIFVFVWIISLILALPYFFATRIESTVKLLGDVLHPDTKADVFHLFYNICGFSDENFDTCTESNALWASLPIGKRSYTVACFIFQYLLPLCALIFVYSRISKRMRNRLSTGPQSTMNQNRRRSLAERQSRTNLLLVILVIIFAVSWFPFNVYVTLTSFEVIQYQSIPFIFVNVVGMTSACANPILYGAFNENFRTEFVRILDAMKLLSCLQRCCGSCLRIAEPRTRHVSRVRRDNTLNNDTVRTNVVKEQQSEFIELPAVTCPPSTSYNSEFGDSSETSPLNKQQSPVCRNGIPKYNATIELDEPPDRFLKPPDPHSLYGHNHS